MFASMKYLIFEKNYYSSLEGQKFDLSILTSRID